MKKKYIVFILVALIGIGFFVTQSIIENRLHDKLRSVDALSFDELNFSLIDGSIRLNKMKFLDPAIEASAETLTLNLAQWSYWTSKVLRVEKFEANQLYFHQKSNSALGREADDKAQFDIQKLNIENVYLQNSTFVLTTKANKQFQLKGIHLTINDIEGPVNKLSTWLSNQNLDLTAQSLDYTMNSLHDLQSGKIHFNKNQLTLEDIAVIPKYSKDEYSEYIENEQDLMTLQAQRLSILDFNSSQVDRQHHFYASQILVDSVDLEIYRDKSVVDDTSIKPLYSKSLRDLDFGLQVDSVKVRHLNLAYLELYEKNKSPGHIVFNAIDAEVLHLHNHLGAESPSIKVKASGEFTKDSSINFYYNFNPRDDNFDVSTELTQIHDKSLNSFFAAANQMKLDGKIDRIKTTFSGNNNHLNGRFDIEYKKLKLKILKKDGTENRFASLITNAFIKNRDAKAGFDLKSIERNPTKSFWNYIWSFHLNGLKQSLL